jgi:hypothetical protein
MEMCYKLEEVNFLTTYIHFYIKIRKCNFEAVILKHCDFDRIYMDEINLTY